MQPITAEELHTIIAQLELADEDTLDALLTDLLIRPYPTKLTQDN